MAARALDLRVPEDVSVVGYDDLEIAAYLDLTTVHQPLFESGYRAASLLLACLEGQEVERRVWLPLLLRVRGTTVGWGS